MAVATIKIPDVLKVRLDNAARALGQSPDQLAVPAITVFLSDLPWRKVRPLSPQEDLLSTDATSGVTAEYARQIAAATTAAALSDALAGAEALLPSTETEPLRVLAQKRALFLKMRAEAEARELAELACPRPSFWRAP